MPWSSLRSGGRFRARQRRDSESDRARLHQFRPLHAGDVRVGKSVQVGMSRVAVNIDMFNALNADSVLSVNNTFGGARPG